MKKVKRLDPLTLESFGMGLTFAPALSSVIKSALPPLNTAIDALNSAFEEQWKGAGASQAALNTHYGVFKTAVDEVLREHLAKAIEALIVSTHGIVFTKGNPLMALVVAASPDEHNHPSA